jgi:hypothetical protein
MPYSVSHQLLEQRKGLKRPERAGELQKSGNDFFKGSLPLFVVPGLFMPFPALSFL